jgi:mono/diheme cytochrome c family protein
MLRRSLPLGAAFAGILALVSLSTLALGAAGSKPAAADRKPMIARGQYLVTIMGCNDCHTPGYFYGAADLDRRLSGSDMAWKGPWGFTFARNLTPDMETGLGYWSEDEIVKAVRTGVSNDGRTLMPPMPWQDFSALTDADAHAIAAYLMSLPAVKHKVHDPVPPGQAYDGAFVEFPPPTPWDAPRPPAGSAK